MNERIKQLAVEAGMIVEEPISASMLYGFDPTRLSISQQKFAELIVEECRTVIDELYHKTPLELCGPLLTADEEIAKHFGVEE